MLLDKLRGIDSIRGVCGRETRGGVHWTPLRNMQRYVGGREDACRNVVREYHQSPSRCRWLSQSAHKFMAEIADSAQRRILTVCASSNIDFPAMRASSGLSLMSILMTCIGLLYSPPRAMRSEIHQSNCRPLKESDAPSQTDSKHLSSQVITTSASMLFCSCHFSGAVLTFLFRSSIGKRPFRVYLHVLVLSMPCEAVKNAYKLRSFDSKSR